MRVPRDLKHLFILLVSVMPVMGFSLPAVCETLSGGVPLELSQSDREWLSVLGEDVVGKALPAKPLHDLSSLMPFRRGTWRYRITSGEHQGDQQEILISQTSANPGPPLWERTIMGYTSEFFSSDEPGAIKIVCEHDLGQKVITRYTPAIPLMFEGMRPGDAFRVETAVKVYDLEDPSDLKYEGHLKVTHTYLGVFEVTVPAGEFQAVLIRSQYKGKVGPAHVVDGGYVFYATGAGIVASVERMHVSAFLFYDKRTQTPKVLIRK